MRRLWEGLGECVCGKKEGAKGLCVCVGEKRSEASPQLPPAADVSTGVRAACLRRMREAQSRGA